MRCNRWFVRLFTSVDPGNSGNKERFTMSGVTRNLSLTSFAHRQFKALVFDPARDGLIVCVHALATRDREGECVDRDVAKMSIDMFLVMGVIDTAERECLRNDLDTEARVSVWPVVMALWLYCLDAAMCYPHRAWLAVVRRLGHHRSH